MGICGSSEPSINPDNMDLTHFSVMRVVGEGGFGKVKAVRKRSDCGGDQNQVYALKMLNKKVAIRRKLAADFFNERNMLALLKHDFICNARYCFQDQYFCFIVMDLCLGGDLRFRCKNTPPDMCLPLDQSRFYIAQVVLAIEYLHECDVLHRDIKPANVVMESDGYIKLTDFGLATKLKNDKCRSTSGTVGFMSPEIYQKGHSHGKPADWFAVGATLSYLATGRVPFDTSVTPRRDPLEAKGWEAVKFPKLDIRDPPSGPKLDANMKQCISDMCRKNPKKRLCTSEAIRAHPLFEGLDWDALSKKTLTAPFIPDVKKANFELTAEDLNAALRGFRAPDKFSVGDTCTEEENKQFEGYDWNSDVAKLAAGKFERLDSIGGRGHMPSLSKIPSQTDSNSNTAGLGGDGKAGEEGGTGGGGGDGGGGGETKVEAEKADLARGAEETDIPGRVQVAEGGTKVLL